MASVQRIPETRLRPGEQLFTAYAGRAADAARRSAARAADGIEAARAPLETLAHAARQLSSLSARYAERMLDQNWSVTQRTLTDSARRLRQLARARNLVSAYREQRRSLPALRDRVNAELRATLEIVSDGTRELSELARDTYTRLARPEKPAGKSRAGARASTRRAPRKKAARKSRAASRAPS